MNPIDWSLKDSHADVFNYYRGLIALRRAHPAFRMTSRAQVDEHLSFLAGTAENVVAFRLKHHANGDDWEDICVAYNGTGEPHDLALPGRWTIVANGSAAGTEALATSRNRLHLAPYSLMVGHNDEP